jgi:hypothetical protein
MHMEFTARLGTLTSFSPSLVASVWACCRALAREVSTARRQAPSIYVGNHMELCQVQAADCQQLTMTAMKLSWSSKSGEHGMLI